MSNSRCALRKCGGGGMWTGRTTVEDDGDNDCRRWTRDERGTEPLWREKPQLWRENPNGLGMCVVFYCYRRHKNRITLYSIIIIFIHFSYTMSVATASHYVNCLWILFMFHFFFFCFLDAKFPVGALRIIYPNGEAKKISRYCGTTISIYFRGGFQRTYVCIYIYQ